MTARVHSCLGRGGGEASACFSFMLHGRLFTGFIPRAIPLRIVAFFILASPFSVVFACLMLHFVQE